MENDLFSAFFTVPSPLEEWWKSVVSVMAEIRILEWRNDHSRRYQ
jgi:hypothetical protein